MTEPTSVAPGIRRLPLPMRTDPGHINSWLLADGDGWVVVDCGTRAEATREVWKAFMASPLYGAGITRIFLTHAHPDHAGSAPWLARETGAPILMAREELRALQNFAVDDEQRDAEIRQWMSALGAPEDRIRISQGFYHHFAGGCPQIHSEIRIVAPGDELDIGGRRWQLHAGYGHTPCNLLLHQPEEGLVITGDQILPEIVTHVGLWWRQSENPLPLYLESLERLRELEVTRAFPAHGDPFGDFRARCDQLRDTHQQRLARIEGVLRDGPMPLDELLKKFGGPAVEGPVFPLVAGQILARLACLESTGRVTVAASDGEMPRYQLPEGSKSPAS